MSSPKSDYEAQPDSPAYSTPPALIAFIVAVLILCFVAFSIVYVCRYCFVSLIHAWAFQRTASRSLVRLSPNRSPPRGLDPSLLQTFPTFLYGNVKDLHKEKYSLECAICLLEFEDDSMLRLLTVCCHVFHRECIDLWLRSHTTCPICRRDLNASNNGVQKFGDNQRAEESGVSSTSDDVSIDIREGDDGGGGSAGDQRHEHEHEHDDDCPVSVTMSLQQQRVEHRLARSHSTGHSIVLIRAGDDGENDDDKYTLRLPEHVIRRQNCSRSCASYKEITKPAAPCSNCGFVQPVSGCSSPSHTQKT